MIRYSPGAMTVPSGNCHFRARPMLSERPYPERSTVSVEELYSSTQSTKSAPEVVSTLSLEAITSVMYTPVSFQMRM